MMHLEQQILAFSQAHALFSPGERVCVAVSGGADSMALLEALLRLKDTFGISLSAAHFHHGLRGAEADRDAAFVQEVCAAHGLECRVGYGDVTAHAAKEHMSIEQAARELRYAFFAELDADRIATAHHADDNLETVLIHLLRGTGLRGMAGIPPKRDRFVRPLLAVSRAEIEAYLAENRIRHIEDSTNAANSHVRNRLRHSVLPALKAENPKLLQTVTRTSAILRQEDEFLSVLAERAAEDCREDGGWRCSKLLALPEVLRRRVLLGMLRALPLKQPAQVYIESLEALIVSPCPSAVCALPEHWLAKRENDLLRFSKDDRAACCPSAQVMIPGDTILSEIGVKINANVTENSNFTQKNLNTFSFRYDMISASRWTVRARQIGDTILLRAGHRTLKRLMIDRKVPAADRDRYPVLLCGDEIAAVLGLAVSERFRPVEGQPVLTLTLLPLDEPQQL